MNKNGTLLVRNIAIILFIAIITACGNLNIYAATSPAVLSPFYDGKAIEEKYSGIIYDETKPDVYMYLKNHAEKNEYSNISDNASTIILKKSNSDRLITIDLKTLTVSDNNVKYAGVKDGIKLDCGTGTYGDVMVNEELYEFIFKISLDIDVARSRVYITSYPASLTNESKFLKDFMQGQKLNIETLNHFDFYETTNPDIDIVWGVLSQDEMVDYDGNIKRYKALKSPRKFTIIARITDSSFMPKMHSDISMDFYVLPGQMDLNRSYKWYTSQRTTGPFWKTNCQFASLEMITAWLNMNSKVKAEDIRTEINSSIDGCTSLLATTWMTKKNIMYNRIDFDDVLPEIASGKIVMIAVNSGIYYRNRMDGYRHSLIIKGYRMKAGLVEFAIYDPWLVASENNYISYEKLKRAIAEDGEETNMYAIDRWFSGE